MSRKYQGQSRIFRLGERAWFWRDARQSALNKIRWHVGHVRGDILPRHVLDDLQASLNVRQLKSRGATHYYDLRRVNRQQLEDVEEDEQ